MTFAEFFHRLFASSWLPGRGTQWQIIQTPSTSTAPIAQVMPFDGILLDFVVLIAIALVAGFFLNWALKHLRRR